MALQREDPHLLVDLLTLGPVASLLVRRKRLGEAALDAFGMLGVPEMADKAVAFRTHWPHLNK
jgi:hypothetical protein